jgi:hypothetical protein
MSTAGNEIVVCSKLPVAISIRLQEKRTKIVKYKGESHTEEVYEFVGPAYRINGTAQPPNNPGGKWPQLESGTALTFGIKEDFFDTWYAQNLEYPPVKNKLIWKAKDRVFGVGSARDSGPKPLDFEPLNVDGDDPRAPKKLNVGGPIDGPPTD